MVFSFSKIAAAASPAYQQTNDSITFEKVKEKD
jgi:hypothetical protein